MKTSRLEHGIVRLCYRDALYRFWTLTVLGDRADRQEALYARDNVLQFIDEMGEPAATALRHRFALQWWRERSTCPMCGGPEFHSPAGDDGRPAHA